MREWRTGDQGLVPLASAPENRTPPFPRRIWIDTDAACGYSRRTDPDDCFAIALLARADVDIAGISTVAGNAPAAVVEATTRGLLQHLGARITLNGDLRAALEEGPLTIVALGPLTNIARVLEEHPGLVRNVARIIAVMGRRPGHLFHPAEGAAGAMFFGHGPVFRDFNFALDPVAAARVLAAQVPVSFVPYDAARGIEVTAADLDRLARSMPWLAASARGWLDYWREDIGREGFYPFDLLAAGYVLEPSLFRCTPVRVRIARDETLFRAWRTEALLIEPDADEPILYCGRTRGDVRTNVLGWLASSS